MVEKVPFTERSPQPARGLISMRKANDRSILSRAPLDMACTKIKDSLLSPNDIVTCAADYHAGQRLINFPRIKGSS